MADNSLKSGEGSLNTIKASVTKFSELPKSKLNEETNKKIASLTPAVTNVIEYIRVIKTQLAESNKNVNDMKNKVEQLENENNKLKSVGDAKKVSDANDKIIDGLRGDIASSNNYIINLELLINQIAKYIEEMSDALIKVTPAENKTAGQLYGGIFGGAKKSKSKSKKKTTSKKPKSTKPKSAKPKKKTSPGPVGAVGPRGFAARKK